MSKLVLTLQRVVSLGLLTLIQPCIGPCLTWETVDLQSKVDVKRIPFEENVQGLTWSVSPFKPTDLKTGAKLPVAKQDKRFVFKGSGQGDGNFAVFGGLRGRGPFSLGSTISLDGTQGLRSGDTSSWVYARYDGDPEVEYQVNLQYRDDLLDGETTCPGWVARAYMGASLMGSMEYPGVAELDVRLLQEADTLSFLARPSAYTVPELEAGVLHAQPFDTLYSTKMAPPDGFSIGFGAFGLDKGGEIYTDMFWFLGPELGPEPGSEEVFVFDSFGTIGACLTEAKDSLSIPDPSLINVQSARDDVSLALSAAMSAMFTLADGIQDGVYDPQTQAKTANKIGKRTYKKLAKIIKQLDKMLEKEQVDQGQIKGICKQLERLVDSSRVGMANMLGIDARSYGQLDRGVPIGEGDLPDIF